MAEEWHDLLGRLRPEPGGASRIRDADSRALALSRESNMFLTRRTLINSATTAATGGLFLASSRVARYRAVALDAFTTLDPRLIAVRTEEAFPGKGLLLSDLWRARQFEYTWLRTVSRTYVDFRQIIEDSLVYAAHALALDLSIEKRHRLLQCFWQFKPWPDALA